MNHDSASKTAAGFMHKIVSGWPVTDLDKLFRSNPNCIYYTPQNEAQHKNMADALTYACLVLDQLSLQPRGQRLSRYVWW